jgi:hypothetical protein
MEIHHGDGRCLFKDIRKADTFIKRFFGLMGRLTIEGDGLFIVPCQGIHCFFMRIPIDVVFIDERGIIVGLEEGVKPWRISSYYRSALGVLELPSGTIGAHSLKKNEKLLLLD